MKIKITKTAWYNERLYEPDLMKESELIIDYTGKTCPSWGIAVNDKAIKQIEDNSGNEDEDSKIKVNELPLIEKNALLEQAKALGIEGNQILSWKVSTLKAKIEEKQAEDNSGNEDEDSVNESSI